MNAEDGGGDSEAGGGAFSSLCAAIRAETRARVA